MTKPDNYLSKAHNKAIHLTGYRGAMLAVAAK